MLNTEQLQQQQQCKLPAEEWLDRAAAHIAAQALRQSQSEQLTAVQRPVATDSTLRQCCVELLQGPSTSDTDWLPQVRCAHPLW
jgi:hypothetical protein